MSDNHLQERAGLNIGIEPTLFPFVQASAGDIHEIAPSGDTVIAEHTEQAARVMFIAGGRGNAGAIGGWAWNTGAATFDLHFDFIDELGNRIPDVTVPLTLTGGAMNQIEVLDAANDIIPHFYCLAPGEKIVARLVAGGA